MGRGGRREEVLRVEGRCQQGWMCGGRGQRAAAATAGWGLQSCAKTVSAGKPERSKKGLVVRLQALVALVIQNMHIYYQSATFSIARSTQAGVFEAFGDFGGGTKSLATTDARMAHGRRYPGKVPVVENGLAVSLLSLMAASYPVGYYCLWCAFHSYLKYPFSTHNLMSHCLPPSKNTLQPQS